MRWNRKLEDMEELKNLQDELFDAASLYDQNFSLIRACFSVTNEMLTRIKTIFCLIFCREKLKMMLIFVFTRKRS